MDQGLEQLLSWVESNAPEDRVNVDLLASKWHALQQTYLKGKMTFEQHDAEQTKIKERAFLLIQQLEKKAVRSDNSPALNDYHRFTCDRVDQKTAFQRLYDQNRDCKTHFFYLYGGDLQAHEGIFRRIAYDLEGRLYDVVNPDLQIGRKVLQVDLALEAYPDLEEYKKEILKSLLYALSVRVDRSEPLLDKTLSFAVQNSPQLKQLGVEDLVCVLVSISHYDWDKELVPAVTRWFIRRFCECDLGEDSPTFLFFFSIDYEEEDEDLQKEIIEIVQASEVIQDLPELKSVPMREIGSWFARYKKIAPKASQRKELIKKHLEIKKSTIWKMCRKYS